MENQLINVDSRFRDKGLYKTPGKFVYMLEDVIRNVSYVRLSSIEIPNIFYTFTSARRNTSFDIIVGSVRHTIQILEGSYTSDLMLGYLMAKLEELNTVYHYSFSITFNEITSCVTIKNGSQSFSLDFTNSGPYDSLGRHLGFNNAFYSGAKEYVAESVLNVIGDQYVYIRVNDYGVLHNRVANKRILAKVILHSNKTYVVYDSEANFVSKSYTFPQPVNIERLDIEILDPLGNVIDMKGQEVSMTFEVGWIRNSMVKERLEGRFNM